MSKFVSHIKEYISLSEEAERHVLSLLKKENIAKNTVLSKEGSVCNRLFFLNEGALRTYYYFKGKDITHWVYFGNTIVTSWNSFYIQQQATDYIEATEDSVIESISFQKLQLLYEKFPELERFGRLVIEEKIVGIDMFYQGFYFLSAKEKYQLLTETFPGIDQRANLGHIASMLGITQETLSRIRK